MRLILKLAVRETSGTAIYEAGWFTFAITLSQKFCFHLFRMEIFQELENHERSRVLAENIFERLSDQDLLELKNKIELAVENCPLPFLETG